MDRFRPATTKMNMGKNSVAIGYPLLLPCYSKAVIRDPA